MPTFRESMSILHDIKLAAEIYAIVASGLIMVSASIAAVRTLVDKNQPPFIYPADVSKAEAKAAAEGYLHRCLVALDIFMNVVFFAGRQGETMSTHAFIAAKSGKLWGKLMNLWLDGFQKDHGPQAASGDLERSQAEVNRLRKILGV
jgi:hypothetical protein